MKKKSLFILSLFFFSFICVNAQVTIGSDDAPNTDAVLDLQSGNKLGLLLPRVKLLDVEKPAPLSNHVEGMVVYNVEEDSLIPSGYYYNNGKRWVRIADNVVNETAFWSKVGDQQTDTTIHFIGTTDKQPLMMRVNNRRAAFLDMGLSAGGRANAAFGYGALADGKTVGLANTAIGVYALSENTADLNTAVGYVALTENTTGTRNVALGSNSLSKNTTASNNTAIGAVALQENNGNNNTAVGVSSLVFNTEGSFNTSVGTNAMNHNRLGGFNAAMGADALMYNRASNNTAVGAKALEYVMNGDGNVGLGYAAGANLRDGASNNIAIGSNTQMLNKSGNNQMNIGNVLFGIEMNGTLTAPSGKLGINATSPTVTLDVNGELRVRETKQAQATALLAAVDNEGVFNKTNFTTDDIQNLLNNKSQKTLWTAPSKLLISALPNTENLPKKAINPENDFIRTRIIGHKEVEIDFLYSAISSDGAEGGGSDYLFTLPDGYAFDLALQPPYTAPVNGGIWLEDIAPYFLRGAANIFIGTEPSTLSYFIIPYDEVHFRIVKLSTKNSSTLYAIGIDSSPLDKSKQSYGGRFTFSCK